MHHSVLMSIMTIVMSIGGIAAPVSAAAHATGAASVLFTIIDAPQPDAKTVKAPEVSSQDDIVFENVNFAYPLRPDIRILDDLNVRFPAGKVTAIVGASGSGKSTIVGLLERWYELEGVANGTDVSDPLLAAKARQFLTIASYTNSAQERSELAGETYTKQSSNGGDHR